MPPMEEAAVQDTLVGDGFAGQRMVVVARPVVRAALTRPVTGSLLVTDAGFFPRASRHGRRRPAGCEEHILLVCTDGGGQCTTPAGTVTVERGDAVVIPAEQPHEYRASDHAPWTLWWLHVAGAQAGEVVRAALEAAGSAVVHLRDAAAVASLVSQVIDHLDAGTSGDLVRASGLAWNALTHVVATGRRTRGSATTPVEQALEHLRATTPRRTSVASLAAMVGLSASQLGTLFRQQVGVPPVRYQRDLRMARARELLDTTSLPVASVAQACGYDDPLYFSRQFHRANGLSPTAFRDRSR